MEPLERTQPIVVPADWYGGFFEHDWLDELADGAWGGFDGQALSFDSWQLILVARKR